MQCDDLEVEIPQKLNELDELRMLSAPDDYLQNRPVINMLSINTRYVSNVSIGFRVRPITPHVRYKPYNLPKREERPRTRSENNDSNNESTSIVKAVLDEALGVGISLDDVQQLKKAKSLESLLINDNHNNGDGDAAVAKLPEVEIVSNCIEKLKVDE